MMDLTMPELDTPLSAGEDDVRQYLSEIRRYPRLTAQEERDLAKRCAGGDETAIRQMVNSNLRLVVSVAREYAGRGVAYSLSRSTRSRKRSGFTAQNSGKT